MMSTEFNPIAKSQNPGDSDWAAMGLTQSVWDTTRLPAEPVKLSRKEKGRIYAREYFAKRYVPAAERNAAIVALKPMAIATYHHGVESEQSKAKTAKLIGKPNNKRSS